MGVVLSGTWLRGDGDEGNGSQLKGVESPA